jgi:cytochrome c nitrite reductase small subunit
MPIGSSLLSWPLLLVAGTLGVAAGVGGYAFAYAKGTSYLGNDPATCANCHVMSGHLDCHTPAATIGKYVTKAANGYHHSMAFTLGGFPDVIRARPESREVIEGQCRHCHAAVVDAMTAGGEVSCIRCHASVGHLR